MYADAISSGPSREEYILGRKIDKHVEMESQDDLKPTVGPGAMFADGNANSVKDTARKVRDDPLFAILKKKQEGIRSIQNNPLLMKQLMQEAKKSRKSKKEKKEKKGKKEKKEKKEKRSKRDSFHAHHASSSHNRQSSPPRRNRSPSSSRSRSRSPPRKQRERSRSPRPPRRIHRSRTSRSPPRKRRSRSRSPPSHHKRSRSRSRSRSPSSPPSNQSKASQMVAQARQRLQERTSGSGGGYASKGADRRSDRERSGERGNSDRDHRDSDRGHRDSDRGHSGRGSRDSGRGNSDRSNRDTGSSGSSKGASGKQESADEIRQRKLKAMMENVDWQKKQRESSAKDSKEREAMQTEKDNFVSDGPAKFIEVMQQDAFKSDATASIEDRISRNRHYIQRTASDLAGGGYRR